MRYDHGHKPRNPLNMIIQENHAAGWATLIIHHKIKEFNNCVDAIRHKRRKNFTK